MLGTLHCRQEVSVHPSACSATQQLFKCWHQNQLMYLSLVFLPIFLVKRGLDIFLLSLEEAEPAACSTAGHGDTQPLSDTYRQVKCEETWAPPSTGVLRDFAPVPVVLSLGKSSLGQSQEELEAATGKQNSQELISCKLNPALPRHHAQRQHGTGEATEPARPAYHGWAARAQLQRLHSSLSRAGLASSRAQRLEVTDQRHLSLQTETRKAMVIPRTAQFKKNQ